MDLISVENWEKYNNQAMSLQSPTYQPSPHVQLHILASEVADNSYLNDRYSFTFFVNLNDMFYLSNII